MYEDCSHVAKPFCPTWLVSASALGACEIGMVLSSSTAQMTVLELALAFINNGVQIRTLYKLNIRPSLILLI